MSWGKRLALAALSGASAWPLMYVRYWLGIAEPSGKWWDYTLIGATFGALVLIPFLPAKRRRIVPVIALVLGSILIYGLVVEFAVAGYGPLRLDTNISIVVSGLIGALLVGGLAKYVVPMQTPGWFWLAVTVAGLFGGFLFMFSWGWASKDGAALTVGYIGWQVAVCIALFKGATSNNALERTGDG